MLPKNKRILALLVLLLFLALPFAAMLSSAGAIVPPYLRIVSPEDGTTVPSQFDLVYVSSDDLPHQVHLYVDGVLRQESVPIPCRIDNLSEGAHTLQLLAVNSQGLQTWRSINVLVDGAGPELQFTHPLEGDVLDTDQVQLQWTAVDVSSMVLRLQVDDEDIQDVSGLESFPLQGLYEGPHQATLQAVDEVGNNATVLLNFSVDTGSPVLLFLSPEKNSYHPGPDLRVDWSVQPAGAVVVYSLDSGTWTPADAYGVDLVGLDEGRHTITVNVSHEGLYTQRSLSFYIDGTEPQLSIVSPLPDMRFGGGTALLAWEAEDISGYSSCVSVDGGDWMCVEGDSLILCGLAAGMHEAVVNVSDDAGNSMQANVSFHSMVSNVPSAPLIITGDNSLRNLADFYGFPGDGSAADPYIISDIGLNAVGSPYALSVQDTTLHLSIQDCLFFNTSADMGASSRGVELRNVRNLFLEGCVAREQDHGLYQDSLSRNISFLDNDFSRSRISGMTLNNADQARIVGNDCSDAGGWGIMVGWTLTVSEGLEITDNDCSNHGQYGIAVEMLRNGTVARNDVRSTGLGGSSGIYLYGGTADTEIVDNDCRENEYGILISGYSNGNNISNNDCRNSSYGVLVSGGANNNLVADNDCRDNPYGICLEGAQGNIIRANDCSQTESASGYGIYLSDGGGNLVDGNNCSRNRIGIFANDTNSETIVHNDCSYSQEQPILVLGLASSFNISGNDCSFAGLDAIRVESPYGFWLNTIAENDCRHNNGSGINISTSGAIYNNDFIGNDCRDSPYDLIHIEGVNFSFNSFQDNILSDAPHLPICLLADDGTYAHTNIQGNDMRRSSSYGVYLQGTLTQTRVLDNNISEATLDAVSIHSTVHMDGVYVDGNDVSSPGVDAINITAPTLRNGSVSTNLVLLVPEEAIHLDSASLLSFSVDDNICPGHHTIPFNISALVLQEVSISGNELQGCARGILLLDRQFLNVSVSRNNLTSTPGILIHLQSNASASGLHVDENRLMRTGGQGILVDIGESLSSSNFNGNNLSLLHELPLTIVSPVLQDIQVNDNICPDAAGNPLLLLSDSMHSLQVNGNDLHASGGEALNLSAQSIADVEIAGNDLRDAAEDAIRIRSPQAILGVRVADNLLQDNGGHGLWMSSNVSLAQVELEGNDATGSPVYPLRLQSPWLQSVEVVDNIVYNAPQQPLWLQSSQLQGISIIGNLANNSQGYGLEVNGTLVRDINISGNEFGHSALMPLWVRSPNDMTSIHVMQNGLNGSSSLGVLIHSDGDLSDLRFGGNTLMGHSQHQVVLSCQALLSSSVLDNIAMSSPLQPLSIQATEVDSLTVSGNDFSESGSHGVHVTASSLVGVSITDNDLRSSVQDGLLLESTGTMHSITVSGNDARNAAGTGISLSVPGALWQLTVSENDLRTVGGDPIRIEAGNISSVLVHCNICPDAASTPLRIITDHVLGLTVSGNDFNRSGSHGVNISAVSISGLSITQNQVRDAQGDGVRVVCSGDSGPEEVLVRDNDIRRAAGNALTISAAAVNQVNVQGNNLSMADAYAIALTVEVSAEAVVVSENDCRGAGGNALSFSASSSTSSLIDIWIVENLLTGNGGLGISLEAHVIQGLRVEENDASGSYAPLVMDCQLAHNISILYNNLSGSQQYGIRLQAEMGNISIIGNDLRQAHADAVAFISDHSVHDVHIAGNLMGSLFGNGTYVQAPSLVSLNIQGNEILSPTGYPLWLSASDSRVLIIMDNVCPDAASSALHLGIPYMNDTLIQGNNLSRSGGDGLNISAVNISDMRVLDNNITDAGADGILIVSVEGIDNLLVRNNDMGSCLGEAVNITSSGPLSSLTIDGNIGGGPLRIEAPSWQEGSIRDNMLTGAIAVFCTLDIDIQDVSGNQLGLNDITLQAGTIQLGSLDDNQGRRLSLEASSGALNVSRCDGNQFSGEWIWQSLGDMTIGPINENDLAWAWFFSSNDMAIAGMDDNHIGPTANSGLHLIAANISITSLDGNELIADGNAIWMEASGTLVMGTCYNNTLATYGTAIMLQADTVSVASMDGNVLAEGMPQRFLFVEADALSMGSFQDNIMSVDSLHEAVKLMASDMEIGPFQGNRLRGAMTIFADSLQMGPFNDNSMQGLLDISVDGPLTWGDTVGNAMGSWAISTQTAQLGAIDNNTLSTDMAFNCNGSLSISEISGNELQDLRLNSSLMTLGNLSQNQGRGIDLQSPIIVTACLEDNTLSGSINISSSLSLQTGSISNNSAASLTILGGDIDISDLDGNALSSDLQLYGASVSISSLVGNTALLIDIHGSELSLGPMGQNEVLGDIILQSGSNLSLSIIQSNHARNISIDAEQVITGSIRQNNLGGSLLVTATDGMSIADIDSNRILGALSLQGGVVQIHDGMVYNTIQEGISIDSTGSSIPVIRGNNLSACPGIGISWIGGGLIETILEYNVITASELNDGSGIRLQADIIELEANGILVTGFQQAGVSLNAPNVSFSMRDGLISSMGDGVEATGFAVSLNLTQVNVSAEGVALDLHASELQLQIESCQLHGSSIALNAYGLVSLSIHDSLIWGSGTGMVLRGNNMELIGCEFRDNGLTIQAEGVQGMLFQDNLVADGSGDGLQLTDCNDIIIRNNVFQDNDGLALRALGCQDMLVAWNEFLGNNGAGAAYDPAHLQCYDDGSNNWSAPRYPDSDGAEGNVWSDWLSPDADNDGIVDSPYVMEGGASDPRPLTQMDDVYPPYLRISSPAEDSKYSQGILHLEWQAMDNRSGLSLQPVTVELDGVLEHQSWDYHGSWSISIPGLAEGWHTITVRVVDNDGNAASTSISFLVDRSAPVLSDILPADASVHGSTVTVSWNVLDDYDADPRCDIRVDNGAWIEEVSSPCTLGPLSEGLHVIELRAVDHLDNTVVISRQIRVDLTPPVIVIQNPVAAALLDSGSVELRWTVSDLSSHQSFVSTDNSSWILDNSGTRVFQLADGQQTLYLKAVDEAGNTAYRNVSFRIDTTSPTVSIIAPSPDALSPSGTVTMSWTVDDASTWSAEVSSGASWTSVGMVGSYEFNGLQDGERTLSLRVTDAAGNLRMETVSIRVDSTAPLLSIIEPSNGSAGNSSQVVLRWSLSDFSDCIVQVWWDGNAPEVVEGDSHLFILPDGTYELHVRATDDAGWSTERWVTVTVDTTPPSLSIDSPSSGDSVLASNVQVDWTTDGVRSEISLEGGSFQDADGTAMFSFSQSGTYTAVVRSYDSLDNMEEATVTFQVVLTTVSARDPEGQSVPSGNTKVSLLLDKAPGIITVQVNGVDAVYSVEGNYVNISLDLMADTVYNVSVTGTGADGSEIVGGEWQFHTEVETLGATVVLAAALMTTAMVFVLVRPRGRRF